MSLTGPAVMSQFAPMSLVEVNAAAEALTRVDRKYLVGPEVVEALADRWSGRLSVLEIDGRRTFAYHSQYFDTSEFELHRAAATKRRHRFKVRTRRYETGLVVLEVKAKDGRGRTVKHRVEHRGDPLELDATARAFVVEVTGAAAVVDRLRPSLTTDYLRTTVVDVAHGSRATIDHSVVCATPDRRQVGIDAFVVETKSSDTASDLDRWLWSEGVRPTRVSKYCTALAVLHPGLPANAWTRTIRDHVRSPGARVD